MYYFDNFVIYSLINCKRCKVGKKNFDSKKTNKNKTKNDINNWFKKKKGVNWGILKKKIESLLIILIINEVYFYNLLLTT